MTDIRAILPSPTTGAPLNAAKGFFSVLVPIARTNEITNPSFETGTTSWVAVGGSIARQLSGAPAGTACLSVSMSGANDGVRYSSLPMTAGELRACSCQFRGTAGRRYKFQIEDGVGGTNAKTIITATGGWQEVVWYCQTLTTATYYLFIGALAAGSDSFLLDAVQVEVIQPGETYSSYIDGDQVGFVDNPAAPDYGWNGTPHASTSYRSGQCRAGGMPMSFDLAAFILTAIIGLGMAPTQHIASPYAQLDGARYERTRLTERTFNLVGRADGRDDAARSRQLALLESWLTRDGVSTDQPLRLRYQRYDGLTPVGAPAQIDAVYTGGLEGNIDTRAAAALSLQFTLYAPYVVAARGDSAPLSVQQTVASANNIMLRTPGGQWQALGTGVSGGRVSAVARGADGTLYAGGGFTSASGVANTNRIAKYSGGAWQALGTGTGGTGDVLEIAILPNGQVVAGGAFTAMGGVANTSAIAKWNGSAWQALGTGMSGVGNVQTVVAAPDGSIYAGGTFTAMGGVANTNAIAKWNGSAWVTLGNANNAVLVLLLAPDGTLYAGGDFTVIGGVAASRVAKYSGGAWSALGSGSTNDLVRALALGPNGALYAGGKFTQIGGVAAARIAVWNGASWRQLGGGVGTLSTDQVLTLVMSGGDLLIGGTGVATAGGVYLGSDMLIWNGATFRAADALVTDVYAFSRLPDGSLAVGYNLSGARVVAGVVDVVNSGGGRAWPVISITGSSGIGSLYQINNRTTGRGIGFAGLVLAAGETVTLTTDPARLALVSSLRGDISGLILPGSQEAEFFLQPGTNTLTLICTDSAATASIAWQPTFQSLNQLVPR